MDLWTLPEVKAEEKEKTGITPESLEEMTTDAFVALGEAKIAAFLKEVGAPDTIKPAMLLEGVKGGKMTPKQMADMLKQMPKPKDAAGADPKQKALLAFSDKELQGKGFVNWTPFKHPTLGDVEIGGMVPFADTTPPAVDDQAAARRPGALGAEAGREAAAPEDPQERGARRRARGVYALTVWVENTGYLPFPTAMGRKNQHVPPAIVRLGGKDGAKDAHLPLGPRPHDRSTRSTAAGA